MDSPTGGEGGTPAPREDSSSDQSGLTFDFEARVKAIISKWVVGVIFGLVSSFVYLQFKVFDQVWSAGSSAWGAVTEAVSSVTSLGFGVLEIPFNVAREMALSLGPASVFVGPVTFALVAAFVMLLITVSWYLWQVIPGT